MKTFESFALTYIKSLISVTFHIFPFAYRANRSSVGVISVWLHEISAHLEKKSSYARTIFIDCYSVFNTIKPAKSHCRLLIDHKFPVNICDWILDFIICRKKTDNFTSRSKFFSYCQHTKRCSIITIIFIIYS